MASFDNSYYNILERYNLIREESLQDQINRLRATLDSLKAKNGDSPELQNSYKELDSVAQSAGLPSTPQGGVAQETVPATAAPTSASTAPVQSAANQQQTSQPAGETTQQQKDLFRKLHGTSYNPSSSMDKDKMEQLQSTGSEVGYDDVSKLTNATYAKQYANTPQGAAYAKQAGTAQPAATQEAPTTNAVIPSQTPGGTPSINVTPSWIARSEGRPAPLLGNYNNSSNPLQPGRPGLPTGSKTPVYNTIKNATRPASPAATTSSPAKPASPTTTTKK